MSMGDDTSGVASVMLRETRVRRSTWSGDEGGETEGAAQTAVAAAARLVRREEDVAGQEDAVVIGVGDACTDGVSSVQRAAVGESGAAP